MSSITMANSELSEVVSAMRETFNRISGAPSRPWDYSRHWYELARRGYTEGDVEVFCLWVKHQNLGRDPKYQRRFHVPRMFGNISEFASDLSMAIAWQRNLRAAPTAKEQALQDLRPVVDPELEKARLNPPRSAGDVLGKMFGQQ